MRVVRKRADFGKTDAVLSEFRRAVPRHEHDVRRTREIENSAHRTVKWLPKTVQNLDKMEYENKQEVIARREGERKSSTCLCLKNYLLRPFRKEAGFRPLSQEVIVLNGPCRVPFLLVISLPPSIISFTARQLAAVGRCCGDRAGRGAGEVPAGGVGGCAAVLQCGGQVRAAWACDGKVPDGEGRAHGRVVGAAAERASDEEGRRVLLLRTALFLLCLLKGCEKCA